MLLHKFIRSVIREAVLSIPRTRTKTAKELISWAQGSKFTCDQKLVDSKGDMRGLFDMILSILKRQGEDPLLKYSEDEETAFYDFAANYDKGIGYWKRIGEKIFGDDLWGYGQGVDANVKDMDRFMIVFVANDKVHLAVQRIERFGWWCNVGEPVESLGTTPLVVSPVALEVH